ncbi:ASCH domain-containing protein [Neisseria leonii]|uniref:ASCH domain-containing protein n=1 Tax=Neisseria leonii TaxID=2995413 RepID=UPI00237B6F65|nr:ASCH domain-containing protein [Neisseria sp. 3986]MDD9325761.1 ASCH domain-containing protein [Neisseria sp. 3986]
MMTIEEIIKAYQVINPDCPSQIQAWQFGIMPDELAQLVVTGQKTATASAYDAYLIHDEPLPSVTNNPYSVVLNSQNEPVCIIKTTKVTILPFKEVSADHAYKEGEGNRSLAYWRQIHWKVFSQWLAADGAAFTEDSLVVCEEFGVVYYPKKI